MCDAVQTVLVDGFGAESDAVDTVCERLVLVLLVAAQAQHDLGRSWLTAPWARPEGGRRVSGLW